MPDLQYPTQVPPTEPPPGKDPYSSPKEQREKAEKELKQLESELTKGQEQLQKDQKKVAEDTKSRDEKKVLFTSLDAVVKEIEQVAKGYDQALKDLEAKKATLTKYQQTKQAMVEVALGEEKKKKVDEAIKAYGKRVSDKRHEADALKAQAQKAGADLEAAQKTLADTQSAYDALKSYLVTVQASLKSLEDIRQAVEKQEGEGAPDKYFPKMFVLLSQMPPILDKPEIKTLKTKDQLDKELGEAWVRLQAAKSNVPLKKQAWDEAKSRFEKADKEWLELKTKRIANLLQEVGGLAGDKPPAKAN